jgi:hypothetical protein
MAEEQSGVEQASLDRKARREKGAQDRLGQVSGALVLIWLGSTFLMTSLGYWEWSNVWGYFLGGLGVIILLETFVRLALPTYRQGIVGRLIGAVVLIGLGFGGILGLENWWPLVVILVGLLMLVGVLTRGRTP